jgi:hypothetical protein
MKIEILYDASDGTVLSVNPQPPSTETAPGLTVSFMPLPGQMALVLDVPHEFEHLDPARFHRTIRIDVHAESPCIIAVT